MSLRKVVFNRPLLLGSELWLCIGQLERKLSELGPGSRTSYAAEAVSSLLRCDEFGMAPIDRDCDSSALTRLLLLPELSLAWEDWETVNAAVALYNKPLLVVAGVGFARADALRGRVPFLPPNVSAERNVNFGCAWVHLPATNNSPALSESHFYCKTFAEQAGEAPAFDPLVGSEHLVLEFDDCSIAPVICADLLAESQPGRAAVVDKLREHLHETERPVIVAASVLQKEPWHGIWSSRIDRAVDAGLILVVANYSHDNRPLNYENDANRNLSGAYARSGLFAQETPRTVACNSRDSYTSKAAVIRDSCQVFAAGTLRVKDFSATTGRHLWMARWGLVYSNSTFSLASSRLDFEIPRLCMRTRHFAPSAKEPISEVVSHLLVASSERKKALFLSLLNGPDSELHDPDPASTRVLNDASEIALAVTDALIRADFFEWPDDNSATLKTQISDWGGEAPLDWPSYVWRSATDNWTTMASKLQSLAHSSAPSPAIVVFAEDSNGVDVSTADISAFRDVTEPASNVDPGSPRADANTVIVVPFSEGKRLSALVSRRQNFNDKAASIRDTIIKLAGVRLG